MNKFERETGRSRKLLSQPKALNILARKNFPLGTPVTIRLDISKEKTYAAGLKRRIYGYILKNLRGAREVNAQGVVIAQKEDYAVLLMGHGPQSYEEGRKIFKDETILDRLVGFPYTELKRLNTKHESLVS